MAGAGWRWPMRSECEEERRIAQSLGPSGKKGSEGRGEATPQGVPPKHAAAARLGCQPAHLRALDFRYRAEVVIVVRDILYFLGSEQDLGLVRFPFLGRGLRSPLRAPHRRQYLQAYHFKTSEFLGYGISPLLLFAVDVLNNITFSSPHSSSMRTSFAFRGISYSK